MPEIPKQSRGDVGHAIVRAGLSAIPYAGGPAVELVNLLVQPPIERRRDEWMQDLGERLLQLESQGLSFDNIHDNEPFVSAVLHATQAALRTHNAAKREALRNAILNVAVGQCPDETVQHLLMTFIADLTEMHLRILKVFDQPEAPPGIMMGSFRLVLERAIPELKERRDVYDQLWRDLHIRGLVGPDGLHAMMSEHGMSISQTTAMGKALLRFIAEPVSP